MLISDLNFTEKSFINLIAILLSFFVAKKLFDHIKYLSYFFKLPKDPECSFLFGDLLKFRSAFLDKKYSSINLVNFVTSNAANYQIKAGLHAFWIGWWPRVVLNDYKSIEALVSKSNITKPTFYRFIGMSEGLITSSGEKWKMRRKMIEPFYVSKQQKKFALTIDEVFDSLVNEELVDLSNQRKYSTLSDEIRLSTFNIICKVTGDVPIDSEREEKLFAMQVVELFETITITRMWNPLYWSDTIFYSTKFGRKVAKMATRCYNFVENFVIKSVEDFKAISQSDESSPSPTNFVTMLAGSNRGTIDSKGIIEELITTAAAGHESTASSLNWTMFILGNRLDIQEKLYQEISSVFEDNESVNDIEKIKSCDYLDKCIKESMRLYPSIPLIARELDEPMEINGYNLPKGSIVLCSILSIHRDPRIYPNPTEYDPERFDSSNLPNIPKEAYIPFGIAPRACIGSRFSLIEMKIFLIHLIRRYEIFSAKKLEEVSFKMEFNLKPLSPLEIMLRKRKVDQKCTIDNHSTGK